MVLSQTLFTIGWRRRVMKFVTYGPYEMPRRNGLIDNDNDTKAFFWNEIDSFDRGLADAIGCYVFTIRSRGGGSLPWYVGKTERGFRAECFQSHKLVYYNQALAERVGIPQLFLIPKITPRLKFSKGHGSANHDIHFME